MLGDMVLVDGVLGDMVLVDGVLGDSMSNHREKIQGHFFKCFLAII